jgi:hypothetical protein
MSATALPLRVCLTAPLQAIARVGRAVFNGGFTTFLGARRPGISGCINDEMLPPHP